LREIAVTMAQSPFNARWRVVASVNIIEHIKAIHCSPEFVDNMAKLVATVGHDPDAVVAELKVDDKAGTFQFTVVYKNVLNYDSGLLPFGKVQSKAYIHGRPVELIMFKKSENELLMYRKSDEYWLDMTFLVEDDLLLLTMTGNGVSAKEYYKRIK